MSGSALQLSHHGVKAILRWMLSWRLRNEAIPEQHGPVALF
jgi:hypothetical protein